MFNSSLRRVARTCPNSTLVTRQTASTGSTATASFSTRSHQRRYSSSKPPVPPNNGSPAIPATSVKQVGAPRSTDKRPGAESRLSKRKAAKGEKTEVSKQQQEPRGNEWTLSLPSVPSTQHLNPKGKLHLQILQDLQANMFLRCICRILLLYTSTYLNNRAFTSRSTNRSV